MVNAFWLDRDLSQAVRWLVDAHVQSSVLECSLVLTTTVQQRGHPERDDLYFGFPNHPLTKWAARSFENWQYLHAYTRLAHDEWRYRWDHTTEDAHGSWATVQTLDRETIRELDWPGDELTDPPQLTRGWTAPDIVDAYRLYYANEKRHLFEWAKEREKPPWIDAYTLDE